LIGQVIIHFINVYASIFINKVVKTQNSTTDQCSWYFTTFLIDLFPGLLLIYTFSTILEAIFVKFDVYSMIPGNYVSEKNEEIIVNWCSYVKQVLTWIGILLLVKGILFLLYIPLIGIIGKISSLSLKFLSFSSDFKLFFVLILFPLVVNVMIFWISDSLLKKKHWKKEEETLRKSFYTMDDDEIIQQRYSNLNVMKGLIKGTINRI